MNKTPLLSRLFLSKLSYFPYAVDKGEVVLEGHGVEEEEVVDLEEVADKEVDREEGAAVVRRYLLKILMLI